MGIKLLDKNTAEQISAGEVIENPSSVVKELVENALDAGATRIQVEILGGGKSSIIVTDNGSGICDAELPLAFKRFATSKITAINDLDNLSSLGFRGEALPSIAAVAKLAMTTRVEGSLSGSRIIIAAGEVLKIEEVGAPQGTRVEIEELFYNTPARLKFLRADAVESTRINALISELALANPGVAFDLKSASRTLFSSSGDGVLLHVIASIYGNDTAEAMLEINRLDSNSGCSLHGYTSSPHLNRSSRRWITLIVNGRLIKNPLIVNALERGYGDLLPGRRYPLSILHLRMPPGVMDVNVHPAKVEVRFLEPESVKNFVYRSVKIVLQGEYKLPQWPESSRGYDDSGLDLSFNREHWTATNIFDKSAHYELLSAKNSTLDSETGHGFEAKLISGSYRLIGQYLQSYLVVERDETLLLIDQHAAHEKVIYHQLCHKEQFTESEQGAQLTIPLTIDLPPDWRNRMADLIPLLTREGFDIETIGIDSYVIRSVPFVFQSDIESSKVYDILEQLVTAGDKVNLNDREAILKTIACHRSIKAKQPLSRDEMEELLSYWENTPGAHFCPHGRPTVISFDRSQLEKGFLRKGN